jgi:NitT/TauT family transport system ATP-binding protein
VYVMQAHPGTIRKEIVIPRGLREVEDVKDSESFLKLKKQIISLIGHHEN